jgi:Domain of unknown function (DU1801)
MQSKSTTVEGYLASLPADRRVALEAIRRVIKANLDPKYQETMQYGMIGYSVPHSVFPAGYHCDPKQPLPFAGLASQKQHISVYLMGLYVGGTAGTTMARWFELEWAKTGKKLDMGKACVRFKRLEDAALEVIGEAIRRTPADVYIQQYTASLGGAASSKAGAAGSSRKAAKKVSKKAPKKAKGTGRAKPAVKKSATKTTKPSAKRAATRSAKRSSQT